MSKYLDFRLQPRPEGRKTDIYEVWNKEENSLLARISWHAPWRTYALFTWKTLVFEPICLQDITDFIKKLMEERKK
jgi:hypothetical protein